MRSGLGLATILGHCKGIQQHVYNHMVIGALFTVFWIGGLGAVLGHCEVIPGHVFNPMVVGGLVSLLVA